jgi:hypothetical protein
LQEGSATDELRRLRARAYGPDADIEDDPVALRRLHELEQQARPDASSTAASDTETYADVTGTAATADPAGDGRPVGAPAPVDALDAVAEDGASARPVRAGSLADQDSFAAPDGEPDSETASSLEPGDSEIGRADDDDALIPGAVRTPWWRRAPALWIASVVAAAVVASAVTPAVMPLTGGRVAVLQVDPDAERPASVFSSTGDQVVFEEFYGMTAAVAPQYWNRNEVLDCLFVQRTAGDAQPSTGGCAGDGFPPTAALVVTSSFPRELRERFPDGTALQFQVRGSELHVYASEPLVEPTP